LIIRTAEIGEVRIGGIEMSNILKKTCYVLILLTAWNLIYDLIFSEISSTTAAWEGGMICGVLTMIMLVIHKELTKDK